MLGKLLTTLGLGQSELLDVFTQAVDRLGKLDLATIDMRKGQRQALQTMLDVLRDEDVLTSDSKRELEKKMEKSYKGV